MAKNALVSIFHNRCILEPKQCDRSGDVQWLGLMLVWASPWVDGTFDLVMHMAITLLVWSDFYNWQKTQDFNARKTWFYLFYLRG